MEIMTIRRACVLAVAAFGLAACASGSVHISPPTTAHTSPAAIHNPVDILRRAGCTIPPSEKIGQPTVFNGGGLGYYADCYWGNPSTGERLTVWRYPSHAIMLQGNGEGPTRRDGMTFMLPKDPAGDWFAEVFAGENGLASGPTPAMVAKLVGGVIS